MRMMWVAALLALSARAPAAEIAGRIAFANAGGLSIETGYAGVDASGHKLTNMAGLNAGPNSSQVTCTTWRPRNTGIQWNPGAGCTYQHVGVPVGTYVLYARLTDERGGQKRVVLSDWKVVRVASAGARMNVPLSLSPALCGALSVTAPGRSGLMGVRLVPADAKGREPFAGAADSFHLATEADLGPRGVRLSGLREGTYRLTVRQIDRHTANGGSWATFKDIGTWPVRVQAGKVTSVRVPAAR